MARTAEKVESLIDENPDIAGALAVLLEESDDGASDVEWSDVRGDISSGQWGRLIEKGVLVDGNHGFRLANPDAVQEAVESTPGVSVNRARSSTESSSSDDDEDSSWTKWDKGAAVASIGLFAGYTFQPVRSAIGNVINVFLGPVDAVLPFYVVVLILAVITGLYSTLLQSNLMDMDKMGEYQQRMKDIQERRKAAKERGDDEELQRIQDEQMEAMGDQLGMFKEQFRPMVWIMLFTIPVFLWMYWKILDGHITAGEMEIVLPMAGAVEWRDGIVGPMEAWIVWYFLCSMGFTQIIRKALNIQTTPT